MTATTASDRAVYRKVPNVRVRRLPAWEAVLVYTPDNPNLHWLNTSAWLVLELCEGQTLEGIRSDYEEVMHRGIDHEGESLEGCLASLEEKGIVEQLSDDIGG